MFLATTALSEFWDRQDELLFLGPWCTLYERRAELSGLRHRTLPSPWDEPGVIERELARCEETHERLLAFLSAYLNEVHGERHSLRYWRIRLGPWLLGLVSAFSDRGLHLRAALQAHPGLRTWALDPRDFRAPRDTWEFMAGLGTDGFNLQLYSVIMAGLGLRPETRRLPEAEVRRSLARPPKSLAWRLASLATEAARGLWPRDAYLTEVFMDAGHILRLMFASGYRVAPFFRDIATETLPAAQPGGRRAGLAAFEGQDDFERLLGAALPGLLPSVFLEGHEGLARLVRSEWPRPPKTLLTSVGWFYNEYFKLLAAECVEAGGKLIISQHGGAYGLDKILQSERHERSIADDFWTWGWQEPPAGRAQAAVRPMPNPRLSSLPRRRAAPGPDWVLVTHAFPRYPYTFYFVSIPAYHRYESYIAAREDFVASVPEALRASLTVRLPPEDFGWGMRARLADRFSGLRFETAAVPWIRRLAEVRLAVIDHPQTSCLETLAADVPTVLFWDPALWPMRPSAEPYLDTLRKAGILHDSPKTAADKVAEVLGNPEAWWREPQVQAARTVFCRRFAYGRPSWASEWAQALLGEGLDKPPAVCSTSPRLPSGAGPSQ